MLSFADDVPLLVYNSYVLSFYYFLKKVSSNEPILVMFSLVCFSYNAVLHKGRKKSNLIQLASIQRNGNVD